MPTVTVDAEVDLDDIDIDDIIEFVCGENLSQQHMQQLMEKVMPPKENEAEKSVIDVLKNEVIEENLHKFSYDEIHAFFTSK